MINGYFYNDKKIYASEMYIFQLRIKFRYNLLGLMYLSNNKLQNLHLCVGNLQNFLRK